MATVTGVDIFQGKGQHSLVHVEFIGQTCNIRENQFFVWLRPRHILVH